jgi:hypothetical protein
LWRIEILHYFLRLMVTLQEVLGFNGSKCTPGFTILFPVGPISVIGAANDSSTRT